MSASRKQPGEVFPLKQTPGGEVLEAVPELTPAEKRLEAYRGKLYRGQEILDNLTPREWKIRGWLPRGGIAALYAPSGKGKSFYALTLALEVAHGGSFCGEDLGGPGRVLYVAAERPTDQRDRFEAWHRYHDLPKPESFLLLDASPQLGTPSEVEALCLLIREQRPELVVLDTFARMTLGLEENSSKDMGGVLAALDQVLEATEGGSVLVVHHTGKDASKGARGSSAFLAWLDVGIALDGDATALKARVDKSNAGEIPLPEWYKLEEVLLEAPVPGDPPRSSAVLVPTHGVKAGASLEEPVLDQLRAQAVPLTRKQLQDALEEETGKRPSDATINRVLKTLRERGLVLSTGGVTPRHHLPS